MMLIDGEQPQRLRFSYEGAYQKYCVALIIALIRLPGQRSSGISNFVGSLPRLLASVALFPTNFAWSHELRVVLKGPASRVYCLAA